MTWACAPFCLPLAQRRGGGRVAGSWKEEEGDDGEVTEGEGSEAEGRLSEGCRRTGKQPSSHQVGHSASERERGMDGWQRRHGQGSPLPTHQMVSL